MEYSGVHNKLIIEHKDLDRFVFSIKEAMKDIRKQLDVPLGKRNRDCALMPIDHIERELLRACKAIGVNLGSEWGHEIDLSNND